MFNTELDMLEIRLGELFEVVDLFVLVEATHTLQRQPKALHYELNKLRFAKWASKIVHVKVDNRIDVVLSEKRYADMKLWSHEEHQRDAIGTLGFSRLDLASDALLLVSDVDEI